MTGVSPMREDGMGTLIGATPYPAEVGDKMRRTHGGYATTPAAGSEWDTGAEIKRPSAWFEWWTPPDQLAFSPDACDRIIAATGPTSRVPTRPAPAEEFHFDSNRFDPSLARGLTLPGDLANAMWWRLDITQWRPEIKRYSIGAEHTEHADLAPGHMRRKLAMIVQLSDGYEGGQLEFRIGGRFHQAPTARGSVIVFPAWLPHRVTPLTSGERWILILTGWGPAIR